MNVSHILLAYRNVFADQSIFQKVKEYMQFFRKRAKKWQKMLKKDKNGQNI